MSNTSQNLGGIVGNHHNGHGLDPKAYVVGFLFRNNDTEVALIRKINPEWQRGYLNGIGGKIDAGESPQVAMRREFKEETGAEVSDWYQFLNINSPYIAFFVSRQPANPRTVEAEEVDWYPVKDLSKLKILPNLQWLVPLALCQERINGYITKE